MDINYKKIFGWMILSQLICLMFFLIVIANSATALNDGFMTVWGICELIVLGFAIIIWLAFVAIGWIFESD